MATAYLLRGIRRVHARTDLGQNRGHDFQRTRDGLDVFVQRNDFKHLPVDLLHVHAVHAVHAVHTHTHIHKGVPKIQVSVVRLLVMGAAVLVLAMVAVHFNAAPYLPENLLQLRWGDVRGCGWNRQICRHLFASVGGDFFCVGITFVSSDAHRF